MCVWSGLQYFLAGTSAPPNLIHEAACDMRDSIAELIGVPSLTHEQLTTPLARQGLGLQPLDIQHRAGQTLRLVAAQSV